MKYLKNSAIKILLGIFLVGLTTNVYAQDKQAAFQAYNKALELAKSGQYEQSINMFNQAITLAEELGAEGKDIIQRAQGQIPSIYYQLAISNYKNFQQEKSLASLEETIESFRQANEAATEYDNSQVANNAEQIITQLLYTKSLLQFRTEDFQGSMATLDQAINRNPNYAKAYYQKGIVAKRQDGSNLDQILSHFDKAIEVGKKVNDTQTVQNAQESAAETLIYQGATAVQEKNYDEAIALLNRALKYDSTSANAYYRLAEAYNKKALWDSAIENAQKALEYESGGTTDKAKIYYELGVAYKGKENKQQACSSFKNAAYGSFKAPAEHQMEFELECNSTTN